MKKYFTSISMLLCLLFMLGLAGCGAKVGENSAPASIAWNNLIYGQSGTEVPQSELGTQLGEINRIIKPMPVKNGDSNFAPVGSNIFEIKGIDNSTAFAIEADGKYCKYVKKDALNK